MALPDSFAGHPRSIAEVRSDIAADSSLWSPRDALISLLREIDEGKEDVQDLVVAFRVKKDDGGTATGFRSACADVIVAQGIMARVAWRMNDPEG